MITAEQARELLASVATDIGGGGVIAEALEAVIAQAEQITAARDHINDLQAWGQLERADADTLLAILAEDTGRD